MIAVSKYTVALDGLTHFYQGTATALSLVKALNETWSYCTERLGRAVRHTQHNRDPRKAVVRCFAFRCRSMTPAIMWLFHDATTCSMRCKLALHRGIGTWHHCITYTISRAGNMLDVVTW